MISRRIGPRGGLARISALVVLTVGATGCTDAAGYDLDYILSKPRFIATMRTTVAYESQTLPRLPAAGAVPVSGPTGELLPAFSQAQLDSAAATLTNPLPASQEVLARGAVVYRNQCFACHGENGAGNGPVVGGGRFPLGPPLDGGATAGRSDGYLYAVVRAGRGLMPSYGDRISHNDRWAVVHHVRQLQQQAGVIGTAAAPVVGLPAVADTAAPTGGPAGLADTAAPPAAAPTPPQ